MRKNTMLLILGMVFLVLSGLTVSAACCERLPNDGLWCQAVDSVDECDSSYSSRSDLQTCDAFVKCHGTCVNENTGECSAAPELACVEVGGTWYQEPEDQLPACQKGCCVAGEYAYFINSVECKNLATTFNINTDFRPDLTTVEECSALITATTTGACVLSTATENVCMQRTNVECSEENGEFLSNEFGMEFIIGELEVNYHPGILCTAPGLSDCAKSEVTDCKDNKVYYKDTCGNFANIYDSTSYEDPEYWTYIMSPNDPNVCTVSSVGSSTCGNCETSQNTVCRNQRDTNEANPEQGEYVCGDLTCDFEGTIYKHGESWCAGTNGALARYIVNEDRVVDMGKSHRLLTDGFTGEIIPETIETLKDQDTYNTPGSRYFKLVCSFGEVLIEECKDYRNSFCTDFTREENLGTPAQAACEFNRWRTCFELVTKDQCQEAIQMCKWIPGYRWDFTIVAEEDRSQQQGSCVPLVAPGFDFWKGDSQGIMICEMGTVQEHVLYETHWLTDRDTFHEKDKLELANRCYDKCYAIPEYGKEFDMEPGEEKMYPEEIECSEDVEGEHDCHDISSECSPYDYLTEFYDESECRIGPNLNGVRLSDRKGQYCHKKDDENYFSTGEVSGSAYDCTNFWGSESLDEERERDYPIYLTHNEWLNGITERIRSVGDCGYKPNLQGVYSSDDTEIITAIYQMLDQDLEVDRNVTAEQIIYKAKKDVSAETEIMTSPVEVQIYTCSEQGGFCVYGGVDNCVGGNAMEGEGLCPHQAICCVAPELG